MDKGAQMPINMEQERCYQFRAVAAVRRRSAAQSIRDLMRPHVTSYETPNMLTAETILNGRKGEDIFQALTASDLFKQLDILPN
ncbi:hypothetical protein [Collimonas antrihumi]|uniref:hypothetical protein n=1 Tax=Collimonas antrihumi TaxID=1940615 RepID=UPI001B8B87B2|nr:hypothetical protein [Collimonas antrihumi]